MHLGTVTIDGKSYVLLPREEYDRLTTLAKAADLPKLPASNASGNFPAAEFARASLARDIIRERVAVGLNQKELAQLAGVRVETLCRLEAGKRHPSLRTVEKIDRALKAAREKEPTKRRTAARRKKGG